MRMGVHMSLALKLFSTPSTTRKVTTFQNASMAQQSVVHFRIWFFQSLYCV